MNVRRSGEGDQAVIAQIINDSAEAYRGVIPADRWHDPYMSDAELASEIAAGVEFWVAERDGVVSGVMGIQDRGVVTLIRHAYVATAYRRGGVGSRLLRHLHRLSPEPYLIGTWADAHWAIAFYEKHGYTVVSDAEKDVLLRTYWSVPARQVETSVVLADARWRARAGAGGGGDA